MSTGRLGAGDTAIQPTILDAKGDLIVATAADTPARLAVGSNGDTLVADSAATTGLRYQPAKVINPIYNSAFDIWQRGTSIAILSSGNYAPDRYRMTRNVSSTSTVSRSTDAPTGFVYSAKVQRDSGNTGTGEIYIGQALENSDSARFVGQTVTFSYWAKAGANFSGASSQFYARILTGTGTDQPMYDFTSAAYTGGLQTITTTWTRYTVTGTLSGSAKQVGVQFLYTPVGTAGADDSFYVTGLQLELGSTATAWSRAGGTIQGELAACQRYYYRHTAGAVYSTFGQGNARSTTNTAAAIIFPVPMRTAPTALDSGTASNYRVYDGQNATTCTTLALESQSDAYTGIVYTTVASGLTATRSYTLDANNTTSAYIGFTAEL